MATTTHAQKVLASSENPNWRSPRWLIYALDREFGIILDAAADAGSVVIPNGHFLGPGGYLDDGLCGVDWWDIVHTILNGDTPYLTARRAIYCNPPYSIKRYRETREPAMLIENWVKAMAEAGRTGTVIGVIPYSPQTEWWRYYVEGHTGEDGQPHAHTKATEVRKLPFRVAFDPPPDYTPPKKIKADGSEVDGKASGANVNTAVVIWRANEYIEPWTPSERYWVPREYHESRRRPAKAVRGDS